MRFKRLVPLFVVPFLVLVAALPVWAAETPQPQPVGIVAEKIVGGAAAPQGQNRWITSVQKNGHFCGAALIADGWVLTAGHCVIGEKAKKIRVWVGGYDLRQSGGGQSVKVKKIHLHPGYDDDTLRNDLALLELQSPVDGSLPRAVAADAAITSKLAKPGKVVTVSGWGALSENGASPNVLHEVALPVVSNAECNSGASYGGEIVSSQLCAGLRDGGKDSCYGDSGGPLWASHQGQDHLLGIVSWGEGCALPRKYGVYTRVASFKSWIDGKLANGGGGSGGGGSGDGGGQGGGGGGGGQGNGKSCRDSCGGNAGRCWCDVDCVLNGDCCRDYEAICGGTQTQCTDVVCGIDPYCCNVEWDFLCEDIAADSC